MGFLFVCVFCWKVPWYFKFGTSRTTLFLVLVCLFSLNSRVGRHTQMGACVGFPFVALDQFCPEDNQTFCATLMSMLMVSEYSSAILHDCSMRK